jgi:aquaporin Z
VFGMLAAASLYIRIQGRQNVYCAKVFHDLKSTCPFACNIERLYREPEPSLPPAADLRRLVP